MLLPKVLLIALHCINVWLEAKLWKPMVVKGLNVTPVAEPLFVWTAQIDSDQASSLFAQVLSAAWADTNLQIHRSYRSQRKPTG